MALRLGIFFLTIICGMPHVLAAVQFDTELPGKMKWSKISPVGTVLVGGSGYLANIENRNREGLVATG